MGSPFHSGADDVPLEAMEAEEPLGGDGIGSADGSDDVQNFAARSGDVHGAVDDVFAESMEEANPSEDELVGKQGPVEHDVDEPTQRERVESTDTTDAPGRRARGHGAPPGRLDVEAHAMR